MPTCRAACARVALVGTWYAFNLFFNVGMKRCFKAQPDAMSLTALQLLLGTLVLAPTLALDGARAARAIAARRGLLLTSACLFLGGTLSTNLSLTMLSISFTQVVKSTEPVFTLALCFCVLGEAPNWLSTVAVTAIVLGVIISAAQQISFDAAGFAHGLLANLCLQSRNVVNKSLLAPIDPPPSAVVQTAAEQAPRDCGHAQQQQPSKRQQQQQLATALSLLFLSFALALAIHSALQCVLWVMRDEAQPAARSSSSAQHAAAAATSASAVDHRASANATISSGRNDATTQLWMLTTPAAFVGYQTCSILVLSAVHPVYHAVLNGLKRAVVIGKCR